MNDFNEADAALRQLVHEWSVQAELPPRFQEQVWRKIERTEVQPPVPFWGLLKQWVEKAMSHRAVALAYVCAWLMLGLAAGYWQAQEKTAQTETNLRLRYVQTVDPYHAPRF